MRSAALERLLQRARENLREFPRQAASELSSALPRSVAHVRSLLPRSLWHWLTVLFVLAMFGWFAFLWVKGHRAYLIDPDQQTDDVRTSLIGFHRYDATHSLADDPVAVEMLSFATPAVWLLYRVLVPLTDLYWASKIVQDLCLLSIVGAGAYLALHRRAGLASGLLLVFFCLYTAIVKDRINSGLARAFGFPALAWWIAGALTERSKPRYVAAAIAAVTYPPSMAMILGSEGVFLLRQPPRWTSKTLLKRLRTYAALVLACAVLVSPAFLSGDPERGSIHTLEQAEKNPAFSKRGRLYVLPFDDPIQGFASSLLSPFDQYGKPFSDALQKRYKPLEHTFALVLFASLLVLPLARVSPPPLAFVALVASSPVLYLLARLLAFRLYSPIRFFDYHAVAVTFALVVGTLGFVGHRLSAGTRAIVRNLSAGTLMAIVIVFVGDGVHLQNCCINRRSDAALWTAISRLPSNARVAAHVMDADGIPYWGARANTGGYETIQPWFVGHWKKQERRAHDTLRALYATDRAVVLDFARRYEVTHFMINTGRYGQNYLSSSGSFEPLTTFAQGLLRNAPQTELVLGNVPEEAVVFKFRQFRLVDVSKLSKAWAK
jgi:hypothetical protein